MSINDLIKKDIERVRSIDVAQQVRVSKPSAHIMLNTLREMGIITKDQNGVIKFTQEGQKLAYRYSKYYDAWQRYLDKYISDSERRKSAICAIIAELTDEENKKICDNI